MLQHDFLFNLKENLIGKTSFRSDCPICGNRNTFIASINAGQIQYKCFHASCNIGGRVNHELSIDELRSFKSSIDPPVCNNFILPSYFKSPLENSNCLNFLKYWHLLPYYVSELVKLYYDPKQNRCVFLIKDQKGEIKGATGRSLSRDSFPKWFIYSRLQGIPAYFGRYSTGNKLLLVEDCISAITISDRVCSCALLGTSISMETMASLLVADPSLVILALDDDATGKAVKLQHQLSPYFNTKILSLKKDIKYFSNEEKNQLEEIIKKWK